MTIILVSAPLPFLRASSKIYCGHCVDLPVPVPPETTTTDWVSSAFNISSFNSIIGNFSRKRAILASSESISSFARLSRSISSCKISCDVFACSSRYLLTKISSALDKSSAFLDLKRYSFKFSPFFLQLVFPPLSALRAAFSSLRRSSSWHSVFKAITLASCSSGDPIALTRTSTASSGKA